jgi:hypothetical protein
MTGKSVDASHWNAYAARFNLVGQPLRPGPEDVELLSDAVRRLAPTRAPGAAALLLGVTSELAAITWEPPLQLLAVDRAEGMVNAVWPGDTAQRRAIVGDWLELSPPPGGFELALGDGVLSLFEYPAGYVRLGSALARLVRPGGLCWLRLFCRPEPCETVKAVVDDLFAGRIGNFHVFKWRLAMALQGDATQGVELAAIWDCFERETGGARAVAERTGYPLEEVATIEAYRGVGDRYSFSTESEVEQVLSPHFELLETARPRYELGARCPHLVLRRRASPPSALGSA